MNPTPNDSAKTTPTSGTEEEVTFRKKTFVLDNVRAVPDGVVETVATTFSILLAVRVFDAGWTWKALLVALPSVGLLLSLFAVQLIRRGSTSVNRVCALVWLVSASGFALASFSDGNFTLFLLGMTPALVCVKFNMPLISQIYRKHYPGHSRGRLFALTGLTRKALAVTAALFFGWLLGLSLSYYPWLLGTYAVACLLMAGCVLAMEPVHLRRSRQVKLFDAFRHVSADRPFRRLLGSWMILGFGNLLCMALFVEYITNPDYGYRLGEQQISLITTVIPEVLFFIFIVPWGAWFDRMNFYVLRITINLIFAGGILCYYLGHSIWALCLGIALHGVAKAGGNVAWSLWVTKFAHGDNVAEYMSVHTFLTGVRGCFAPFIAFPAAAYLGPQAVGILGASMILLASIMVAPGIKEGTPAQT